MSESPSPPSVVAHPPSAADAAGGGRALQGQLRSLRAAVAGNVLEWFDWTLYSIFSTYIAAHFFDKSDPSSALLSTLAVFAVGFLARPLGGLVFGRLADRRGRKVVLVVTITIMSVSSLVIALVPGYEQIGVWSSVVLLLARLAQGLAHGGESGVSYTYVSEIAPPKRRGLWSSSVFFAVTLGVMLATALGWFCTTFFGDDGTQEYGWRGAFIFGALLGLLVLWLRRTAEETSHFNENDSAAAVPSAAKPRLPKSQAVKIGLLVILLACGHNCAYYVWATFASSFAISQRDMDPQSAFTASLLAQAVALGMLVLWGNLSDRVGRRPMIIAMGIAAIGLYYPLSLLISDAPWTLFVAQAVGMSVWAMGAAMYPAFISELFPTHTRAAGVAVATSVSVALFGGTAPYLMTWFDDNGVAWVFWIWVGLLSSMAIVGGMIVRETKGIDLGAVTSPFRDRTDRARAARTTGSAPAPAPSGDDREVTTR
ncbi:MFS transporter [Streptomyces profundus]|uniref:MFS transporter n=1 Tax=Streptomyces profundus TaxID=2867410 RepID=UPI001D1695EA|nr:MFS transporter [Streptomyces sp. MA3_2.13]UED84502.1 MFS transporter [Streptomyces sp. MA3_2.13]